MAVPLPPPPLRPEHVPPQPDGAVWIDGEWSWDGTRYRWTNGAWVVAPTGGRVAPWTVVRRNDGQLFYSPSVWYDKSGAVVAEPRRLVEGYVREVDGGAPPPRLPDSGTESAE